jgi:hypothetical protein
MNFGQLKTAVADYVNRGDVTPASSLMTTWLELAEQRIYNGTNRIPGLRLSGMLTTVAAQPLDAALPTNLLSIERVSVMRNGRKVPLEFRVSDWLSPLEGAAGLVMYYTVRGGRIVVGASSPITAELLYYARPVTPVADASTNVVLDTLPAVYLWAMVMEAAAWLRDSELLATATPLWADAMEAARNADDAARFSGPLAIASDPGVRL